MGFPLLLGLPLLAPLGGDAPPVGEAVAAGATRPDPWAAVDGRPGEPLPQRPAAVPAAYARPESFLDFEDQDLTELSLEDLMNIEVEVTSVSRKKESRASTPAAIHVLTAEDIRRSGARTVPEALRHVPGLHVARLASGGYAISARGFASEFANKMLVMVDGRSVYSPLFAGVYWQNQNVVLEDVERIEVVLGPGGAMWGANAVNGVINIITKSARDTQGSYASFGVGVREKVTGELRSGVPLDDGGFLRVYGKYAKREGLQPEPGYGEEEFGNLQGGFRADWGEEDEGVLTLQGDLYSNTDDRSIQVAQPTAPYMRIQGLDAVHEGANVLGRWSRVREDGTSTVLQAYYDRYELSTSVVDYQLDTVDLDLQDRLALGERNELTWGLGYRFQGSRTQGTTQVSFVPPNRDDDLFSAFLQDEYRPNEDLSLTLGAKLQHNDYTGFEFQPSGRVALATGPSSTLWAAISRAVRTPSMADSNLRLLNGVDPTLAPPFDTALIVEGTDDFESEELTAYELGYRFKTGSRVSWDVALFLNDYDSLSALTVGAPGMGGPTGVYVPLRFENGAAGQSWGGEVAVQAAMAPDWTLGGGFSHIRFDIQDATGADTDTADTTPRNQVFVETSHDLGPRWELDGTLFWVDRLRAGVDSYTNLVLRLGYRASEHLRLSVGVQGLFHDREQEYPPDFFGAYYGNRTAGFFQLELLF